MANKQYKLTLSLSDGNKIDAGTILVPQGDKGETGSKGATFTPSVSEAGVLSWTNNGGLTNPTPVNIKGPKGDDAVITAADVAGWGFTKNAGTITGIKMNGVSKGTSGVVDLGTVLTSHQDISGKLDKTQYEVSKTINFGSSGVLKVGKFKVYDTNITCEITSTTSVTYSGKLVIATQNYVIKQMTVYGDAANTIAPNIFVKPSSTSDPYVEVYFKPASWSKNIVHFYGSAIAEEPTEVCTSVSAVPSTATSKPTNALTSALSAKQDKLTAGSNITISGNTISASVPDISGKANLTGGNTFTGKQTLNSPASDGYSINAAGYIKGSWLQASATSNKGANTGKVCVFDDAGWIYYRTPAEILTEAGGAKTSDIPTLQWVTPTSQDEITSAIMWKVSGQSILNTYDSEQTRYILYGIGSGSTGTVAAVGNNSRRGAVQLYFGAGSYWGITGIVQEGQSSIVRHVPMQSIEGVTLSKWKILKYA